MRSRVRQRRDRFLREKSKSVFTEDFEKPLSVNTEFFIAEAVDRFHPLFKTKTKAVGEFFSMCLVFCFIDHLFAARCSSFRFVFKYQFLDLPFCVLLGFFVDHFLAFMSFMLVLSHFCC